MDSRAGGADKAAEAKKSKVAWPDLRVWLAALHVAALLVMTGFVVQLAEEQFMGITFLQWDPADLSIQSGRWLVDTLVLLFQWMIQHWFLAFCAIAGTVLFCVVVRFRPAASRVRGIVNLTAMAALCGMLLYGLAEVEVPAMTLNRWLTAPLNNQFLKIDAESTESANGGRVYLSSKHFLRKVETLNETIFLSRAAKVGSCIGNDKSGTLLTAVTDAVAPYKGNWGYVASLAKEQLQGAYCLVLVPCLLGWVVVLAQPKLVVKSKLHAAEEMVCFTLSFLLLPVCSLLVPYTYGKLIGPGIYPHADVQMEAGKPNPGMPDPFVVERTEGYTSLLYLAGGSPQLQFVRNEQMAKLTLQDKEDVLQAWNAGCWWNPQ